MMTCILGGVGLLGSSQELSAQDYVPATGWRRLFGSRQWVPGPTATNAAPANTAVPMTTPAPAVAPAPATAPAPAVTATPVITPAETPDAPKLEAGMPKVRKHEISAAADFMLGEGEVTVPIGYSLKQSLGTAGDQIIQQAASAERSSIYFGGSVSYSYNQAWQVDLSYVQGNSEGNVSFPAFDPSQNGGRDFKTQFTIDDQWYQAYLRYNFKNLLRGSGFSAYLRAGISYVTADLSVEAVDTGAGRYSQTDATTDILGSLGFGVTYELYKSADRKFRAGLSAEGEGFYGYRNQDSRETLSETDLDFVTAKIDNTLYGGIGRVTLRLDYLFGQTGVWKAYGEVGAQVRYTLIDYPNASGSNPSELLWGPYAKIGLRYNF